MKTVKKIKNYKTLKLNEKLMFITEDFDGRTETEVKVIKVNDEYALAESNGINYWIDNDTLYQFYMPLAQKITSFRW